MAVIQFSAHRALQLPALIVVDPVTGEERTLGPVEADMRVETFGPFVQVTASYGFGPAAGPWRCRLPLPERARVYGARVGGEEAALPAGLYEGDGFELRGPGLPAGAPLALEVSWVQVAEHDGLGWSVRLPAATRVACLAHQAEEAAGNGTGWRTEDGWLLGQAPLRPVTLFWWPERDAKQPRLHVYGCGDGGLAVLVPPRRAGATLPRDVRVVLAVAEASEALAQRVVRTLRAGLGRQDTWRLVTGDEWPTVQGPGTDCVQTLVITDGSWPSLAALREAIPAARVIGLGTPQPDAHLHLDSAASWARNEAGLEAFLAPLESVCARQLLLQAREGEVLAAFGDMGAIGLNWRTWRGAVGVDGPYEVMGGDGRVCVQASPVLLPQEAAWTAFEALSGQP